jgi:phytoene synthase
MMALVLGIDRGEADTLDRACDLGIAFQMTNIARDVVDDAESGRVYLPGEWLREAGVPAGEVARPEHRAAVSTVAGRLLDEADRYYASAEVGVARLPYRSAWAVAAARRVYQDIGRLVRRRGPGAWDRRASTGRGRKLLQIALAAGDATAALRGASGSAAIPRVALWPRPRS